MHASEIRVKRIRINQGVGVIQFSLHENIRKPMIDSHFDFAV